MISLYDLAVHAQLFRYAGTDPNVMGLAAIGHVLLLLGHPDQALLRAEAAIRQARQLAHAPTVVQCLAFNARQASILGDEARLAHWVHELHAVTQEFFQGREAIEAFLRRKWDKELDYRLIKEVWAFRDNRIAVRFA